MAATVRPFYLQAYTGLWVSRLAPREGFRERLDLSDRQFFLEFYPALRDPDLTVYDIGAAKGMFSRSLSKLPNVQRIHAFEPLRDAFQELERNLRQTVVPVVCHRVALGDAIEERTMTVWSDKRDASSILAPLANTAGAPLDTRTELVSVTTLDDYVSRHSLPAPDVIKVDVQGYEDRVLRGGRLTIPRARYCILEISFSHTYVGGALFEDVYEIMIVYGFRLVSINNAASGYTPILSEANAIFERVTDRGPAMTVSS